LAFSIDCLGNERVKFIQLVETLSTFKRKYILAENKGPFFLFLFIKVKILNKFQDNSDGFKNLNHMF
jgi:hypothetical protein